MEGKRRRKSVDRFSGDTLRVESIHKKPLPTQETCEVAIAATLDFKVGEEVFLRGRISDNQGFQGEILCINSIDKGIYTLGMVYNHSHTINIMNKSHKCHLRRQTLVMAYGGTPSHALLLKLKSK